MQIQEIKGMPDYAQIIDLINTEWPSEFGDIEDSKKIAEMTKSHNSETDTVKYMIDNNKIIGFYRFSLWPRTETETQTAHTLDIAICPDYQGQRLGSMLMTDMINDCRGKGLTRLLSRSFKTNKASIGLHQSLGFRLHLETDDSFVWEMSL